MTDVLSREIAAKIVQEGLLGNWRFYAILLSLLVIGTVINAFLIRYVGKRADIYATKSDLSEVLRQLKATTELTEQVRIAVSHADWVAREWKTVRREKLEELLESTISLIQWLDHQRSVWISQSEQKNPAPPADRVAMLTALYFPELENESNSLMHTQNQAYAWITATGSKALQTDNLVAREAFLMKALPEWLPLYNAATSAVFRVKVKAASVMSQMRDA